MQKKWYITGKIPDKQLKDIDPLLQKILYNRGVRETREIKSFLSADIGDLFDPLMMTDMSRAVNRILTAINKKERIIIYGDYDVDGITATTLLYTYLKESLGLEVAYYLPNRLQEGYGLNLEAVRGIIQDGFNLLITVDCGITALKEVEYACSQGLDIIITDHHQPGGSLPGAEAVVDPHRKDDAYPFKSLAGVGVVFKLCQALEMELKGEMISSLLEELLDIVALGTIADIVPLTGENRILVKKGLQMIKKSKNIGLKTLIKKVGLEDKEINAGQIGYILAPPINAAGRVKDPRAGIRLLTTSSSEEALLLAEELVKINKERQSLEESIYQEAVAMVESSLDLEENRAIVLASEDWHHGVIGIVASRLVERYYRPTVLIAIEDGLGKGSCRSISNLNLYEALKACSGSLTRFGGHAMAAGIEIEAGNILKFREELNRYLHLHLSEEDLVPRLKLDAVLDREAINLELYNKLELLKPYGVGNPRPVFLLNNVRLYKSYPVGKEQEHLKFSLDNGLNGIGFGFGDIGTDLSGRNTDLAFSLILNEWNGNREVQLKLEDIILREEIDYYPVHFSLNNWLFADKRGCPKWLDYLKGLLELKHKVAAYINNLKACKEIKNNLGREDVYFSNVKDEFKRFTQVDGGLLLFTNPLLFHESEVNDLVFLSLPFSLDEMVKMIRVFKGKETVIHLLFGQEQLKTNENIIKKRLPDDRYLRRFYLYLKAMPDKQILRKDLHKVLPDSNDFIYNRYLIDNSLTVLTELGLIAQRDGRIRLLPVPAERLDLSDSISYNDTIGIIKRFKRFIELAFADDLFPLISELQKEDF